MSAQLEVWQHVEQLLLKRAKAKRHIRFRKLQGTEAKSAVIKGTVARLMEPDAVFPYALRKRLAPRPLVVKGVPAGWLGSWRPISSTLWEAWLTVHHQYIERGSFWFEELSAAKQKLIDNALDAERQAFIKSTSVSGGPSADEKLDPTALENLSRLTEAGQAYAREPARDIEKWERLGAEDAALEYRKQIEAEENAKLRQALNEYARKLPQKQRRALNLICFDLKLTGATIAVRCRVSEATVSKIRANVEELADKILTIPPEEGASIAEPPASVPHDETITQIAEAGEVEGAEVDATADLSRATVHSDTLDLGATYQAPDVDADVSESALHGYARHKKSSALMRDNWSGGRRRYSDVELVTGRRYGGRYDDPAKIALRDERKQHANKFSDVEMRELRQKAAAAAFPLNTFLRAIDAYLTKQAAKSADALLGGTIPPKPKPSDQ
jgi:hypothetical protein